MAWKFGPFVVTSGDVVDVDTVNEVFASVVDEVSAQLNEHNFDRGGFSTRSRWADDIALSLQHVFVAIDTAPNAEDVEISQSWHPISTTFAKTFTTKCRKVWVLASFQINLATIYGSSLALELDGAVLGESILGSGDYGNDLLDEFVIASGVGTIALGSTPGLFVASPAAVAPQKGCPVVLDAIIDLPPGVHTVRPVVRTLRRYAADAIELGDYDLIVVEMW